MKIFILLPVFIFFIGELHGQELRVFYDDEELHVNRMNDKRWEIIIGEDTLLVLEKSDFSGLIEQYRLLEVEIELRDSIIASHERRLEAFEQYQEHADEHINVQREIVAAADSLFHGYRSLYNDLKQLVAAPRLGLTGGVGLVNLEKDIWRPVGMLGIQYQRWNIQYQVGRRYHGMLLGFQLPVLF